MIEALIHRGTAGFVTDGVVGTPEPVGKPIVPKVGEGIEFVFLSVQTDLGAGSGDSFLTIGESKDGGATHTDIFAVLLDADKKDHISGTVGFGVIGSPTGERQSASDPRKLQYQIFYERSDGAEKYFAHIGAVAVQQEAGEARV